MRRRSTARCCSAWAWAPGMSRLSTWRPPLQPFLPAITRGMPSAMRRMSSGLRRWGLALQHGHSVQVMLRDYANWIPSADKGANLAAVNQAIGGTAPALKNAI